MEKEDSKKVKVLLSLKDSVYWFLGVFGLLLLRWGYVYGSGDQVEVLPYALKIRDSSLFTNDLFVSHIAESVINQRWAMASLLSWFGDYMPQMTLVLFVITTFLLVRGLQFLFLHFFGQVQNAVFWSFCFVVLTVLLTSGWSPGGNELYAESLLPDSISRVFVVWSLYYFLISRTSLAFVLVGLATLFQPLMGFQLFAIVSGVLVLSKPTLVSLLRDAVIYILGGGWLFLVMSAVLLEDSSVLEMSEYYNIYFEFRAPHHFIPSHFLNWKSALFFLGVGYALFYFFKKQHQVFLLLILTTLGCLIYAIGVEGFNSRLIASTQWFKVTQWMKIFTILAFVGGLLPLIEKLELFGVAYFKNLSAAVGGVILILLFLFPENHPLQKPLDFQVENSRKELYEFVKHHTELQDIFIIQLGNTDFKYGAQRSVFVDFKSVDPSPSFLSEWKRRIEFVYGPIESVKGFDFRMSADKYYHRPSETRIQELKQSGVDYMLGDALIASKKLNLVYKGEGSYLYEIK